MIQKRSLRSREANAFFLPQITQPVSGGLGKTTRLWDLLSKRQCEEVGIVNQLNYGTAWFCILLYGHGQTFWYPGPQFSYPQNGHNDAYSTGSVEGTKKIRER